MKRTPLCLVALVTVAAVGRGAVGDYAVEVLSDKPVAWWRLGAGAAADGTPAADAMGAHPGVFHGDVQPDAGPAKIGGGAVRFAGPSALVAVPHHNDFAVESLSVEFWFKSTQTWDRLQWPGSATFVTKATARPASSDWTINAGTRRAGHNEGLVIASSGATPGSSDVNLFSRAGRLNDGRWHHVVWTRASTGALRLYVDGRLADRAADRGGSIVNSREIQIGGDALEKGTFLNGSLAEVAIYDSVLPAPRVAAHFAAGSSEPLASLDVTPTPPLETATLRNDAGLAWELRRFREGWSLGQVAVNGKLAAAPLTEGVLLIRNRAQGEDRPLAATECIVADPRTARLTGRAAVGVATLRYEVELVLDANRPVATLTSRWSVDKDLVGYSISAPWHGTGDEEWRCTLYPFAGNAARVEIEPLTYCGVPAALLFRPDMSLVTLFGIDPSSDYLNPTTWTGTTGFHFVDGALPPQFRVGGGKLTADTDYRLPLQLFLCDAGESATAITALVRDWIEVNRYAVQHLRVRSRQEGLDLFIQGRIKGLMWREGLGYQINQAWPVVYTAESPLNAWLDYLLFEHTGDAMWRKRAFDAMDLVPRAQHTDPNDPHYGAIETNYELSKGVFNSRDHSPNWHYKVDMNSYAARYMLQLWQRVKKREGIDRQDWYLCAVRMADWVMKQQNPDGGLPQVVDDDPARKSVSVVSGRSLAAFPVICRITGDDRYGRFALQLEQFLRKHVEGRFWFTGAHVDLWPEDFESDSVWHAVEYWLDTYEHTQAPEALQRAEADALFAFLMWCPKQLSWVKNPTQTCHTEQQHYLQYSNYCYNNRKYYCLDRLAQLTGRKLYGDLCERIIQCGFWAQPTSGDWIGGVNERMSDPWKALSKDFNSTALVYVGELATDAALQLLEMSTPSEAPAAAPAER